MYISKGKFDWSPNDTYTVAFFLNIFFISEQTYRSFKRNFILIQACSPYPRSEQHSFTPDKQFPYNGRVRATFDDMCQCQELVLLWPSIIAW